MSQDAQRLERLLEQLIDLPADQRERLIEEQCADDEPLRDELRQLLRHHDVDASSPEFLPSIDELGSADTDSTMTPGPPSPATTVADLPETIGQYRILEEIGAGGMGIVYKAEHTKLQKLFALKVLSATFVRNPQAVQRFEREMVGTGKLEHGNIVRASDAGESDGRHYLVMEYVDGVNLDELQRRHGRLPPAEACEVARQAASGLQHAHEQGLVHRDVKPSNLMLTRDGTVKLLDLGLALLRDAPGSTSLTGTGRVMGTLDYMAPEQADTSHDVDHRADVYGLGATLYKLVAGRAPFDDQRYDTLTKRLTALVTKSAPPVAERCPVLPGDLADLIDRMVARNPDDRPETAEAVALELAPFAAENALATLVGDDAGATAALSLRQKVLRRPSRAVGTLIALGGAIAVALILVSLLVVFSGHNPQDTTKGVDTRTIGSTENLQHEPETRAVAAWPYLHARCEGTMSDFGQKTESLYQLCDRHSIEATSDRVTLAYLDYHVVGQNEYRLTVEVRIPLLEEPEADLFTLRSTAKELGLENVGIATIRPGRVAWIRKPKGVDHAGSERLFESLFEYAGREHASTFNAYSVPMEEIPVEFWEDGLAYEDCETELSIPLE